MNSNVKNIAACPTQHYVLVNYGQSTILTLWHWI